jgi:3-dehydroquinate synthase
MYDFTVKSIVHDYKVSFIDDAKKVLQENIIDGDYILLDRKVLDLYPERFDGILDNTKHILIDAAEPQKSYQGVMPIMEELIQGGFRKNHRLIGIGGGITQDITAFISSIMYRGVDWLFFPTTLLAQGDSCIGSKTSINFGAYKNQVGGFYPPNKIFIDLSFLDSLSEAEIKSGLGEMCHYFIVSGEEDFRFYKDSYATVREDKELLKKVIARSLAIKKSYIEVDEFDQHKRQVFNYGHSFGHAIESLTNYAIPHGIAVSFGMDMANFVSVKKGYITDDLRRDIRELLEQIWEGFSIQNISLDKYKNALSKDKKNVGTELRLILSKGLGKIFKDALSMDDEFTSSLEEYFANEL